MDRRLEAQNGVLEPHIRLGMIHKRSCSSGLKSTKLGGNGHLIHSSHGKKANHREQIPVHYSSLHESIEFNSHETLACSSTARYAEVLDGDGQR